MSRNTTLGVIGGGLIVLAVFLAGSGFDFNGSALDSTTNLVLFLAGLFVALLLIMGKRHLASYAAVAAATIAVIWVVDLLRGDGFEFTVKLVALIIGVILSLMATVSGKK